MVLLQYFKERKGLNMSQTQSKRISLVLGSGGARGLAHIGVIHWLEENGFQIASISGSSMGALIGGIYAAGKLDEYEAWVKAVTKLDIVSLLDIAWGRAGLVKGDKIINTLVELVGDLQIEALPITFTAVATDIHAHKEVWISQGRLFDAIRASISLPLFFTPFRWKETELIDGGVLNPVPIAPTFLDDTDLTIAVNLGGQITAEPHTTHPAPPQQVSGDKTLKQTVVQFIERFGGAQVEEREADFGAYMVADHAFDAMQSTIARQKLAAYPPDHTIEIATNACGTLEFDRASEMIALGYHKAEERLRGIVEA
jgi:NTE family protein